MKTLFPTFALILLSSFSVFGQVAYQKDKIRPEIIKLTDQMARYNVFNGAASGPDGEKTKQYLNYEKLEEQSTNEELQILTSHPNSVVRSYAFQALILRNDEAISPILFSHLHDNERFKSIMGQVNEDKLVGDYFLYIAKQSHCDGKKNPFKLTVEQLAAIDSILLYRPKVRIVAKDDLLNDLVPVQRHYLRVKDIYLEEGNNNAVVALAKYKKPEDKTYISELLEDKSPSINSYGLRAAVKFPDAEFFPLIQKIHNREIKRSADYDYGMIKAMYDAIVQYKDPASAELIDKTFYKSHKNVVQNHQEFIIQALKENPDPVYLKYDKEIIERMR